MKEDIKVAKNLNLAIGIIDIVTGILGIISLVLFFTGMTIIMEAFQETGLIMLTYIMIFAKAFQTFGFEFGISTLWYGRNEGKEFLRYQGKLLFFAILESIAFVLCLVVCIMFYVSILDIIILVLMASVITLRYIGFAYIKKANSAINKQEQEAEKAKQNSNSGIEKLEKLNSLKKEKAITEEEYDEMKKKILEKEM